MRKRRLADKIYYSILFIQNKRLRLEARQPESQRKRDLHRQGRGGSGNENRFESRLGDLP